MIKYIVVRTHGNGSHMNKVYPVWFDWLSQAERTCEYLNESDTEKEEFSSDKWIVMPLFQFLGSVW